LIAVFLLGAGVVALADIAYNVAGQGSGPIPAIVGVTGGLTALIAGLRAIGTLSGRSD